MLAPVYESQGQPSATAEDCPLSQPLASSAAGDHRASDASPSDTVVTILNPNTFNEKSVRLGFIRKVFAIHALQMAVTFGLSCLSIFHKPIKDFVQENFGLYFAGYVLFFVLQIVLFFCSDVARRYPCNMILLGVFTLSLAYMVAAISSFHDTKIVLMVFVITFVVCSAVMLFACQTKYDFTTCGGLLFVLTLSLILFGILAGIFVPIGGIRIVHMVYAGVGALFFMGFLAGDVQLIMDNKRHKINPEDYVFAAMMFYVDIICSLFFLLSLLRGNE